MLNRRKKVAAPAAIGGGLAGLLLLVLLFPGLIPGGEAQAAPVAPMEDCKVVYLALDPADSTLPNPAKESRGAIGTPVTATDPQGQLVEIRERRECGEDAEYDSVLLSSHYADWSIAGLTTRSIAIADIDAFAAEIEASDDLREQVVEELNSLEAASVATNEAVPAGTATIYTVPDGVGGVTTKSGYTVEDGVNLVLTHSSGAVIRYRLDCGAQINWPGGDLPPGLPPCEGDECYPPPPPPPPNDDKDPADDVTPPPGVTQQPVGAITTGNESEEQQASGEVSGNIVDDQASSNTGVGDTTTDLGSDVVVGNTGDAAEEDTSNDVVDSSVTSNDTGGTNGATEIAPPPD